MPSKDTIFKQELIRKDGIFDYPGLYAYIMDWFNIEGYIPVEQEYGEKDKPGGKKVLILLRPYKKISDYFKFIIEIDLIILDMKKVDVEQDGKKVKMNKGEMTIRIRGVLEKDYEKRWEDRPFAKFMRAVYEQYVIRTTVHSFEDKLYNQCLDLHSNLKAFLDLV